MLAYIPYMDPMGFVKSCYFQLPSENTRWNILLTFVVVMPTSHVSRMPASTTHRLVCDSTGDHANGDTVHDRYDRFCI